MKRFAVLCLAFLAICLPAQGETQVFCAGGEGNPAYEISLRLAEKMQGSVVTAGSSLEAVNLFLAADKDSAVFVGDPSVMIFSLQGYTNADLRDAAVPVARIAASPATLYATKGVFDLCEDCSPEGLLAFTEQAPFELFIARLIDASPEDQLTLEATSALYVDQNLYMDWEEMAQAARDGAPDLCVFGADVPDVLKDCLTPLHTVEVDGPFLGAFVQAGAANASDAETAVLSVTAEEEAQSLLAAVGYLRDTQQGQADFSQEVQTLFQRYIQYLTNEGLFFYEF